MALAEFQHCPACERPRGDVGISQRCPDCTCPPEDDLLIIRQSRPSVHALTLAGVVLFVLAVPGMPVGRWPALALLAMGASLIGIRMLIVRRSPRAVLWAEGFCLISWENPPRAFEWESFRRSRSQRTGPRHPADPCRRRRDDGNPYHVLRHGAPGESICGGRHPAYAEVGESQ
jgi:hypothetical protein